MSRTTDAEELAKPEKERERAVAAERERQQERERADRERERADTAEQQTQHTSLDEYIAACHSLVFANFTVETDRRLTSRGSITNPRNKLCPTILRPWSDFLHQQSIVFGTLYDTFPADRRCFETPSFLSGLGSRIAKRKITDEKALEYFLHNSVEDPVRAILDELRKVEAVKTVFDLGNGIVFENHPHALSDVAPEVVERNLPSTPPSTPHDHKVDLQQLRADQICVYRTEDVDGDSSTRSMLYVSEYKPPHKLTTPHLRLGLRSINIHQEIINRKTIPTSVDLNARFQYYAERLTITAITQTYYYIIKSGLKHGLLTTGEAIREPGTLLYYLAEPSAEVEAHPKHAHLYTAVTQYLAFTLSMPSERRLHSQEERHRAINKLKMWGEDFETTLRSIPDEERHPPDSSPGYEPKAYKNVDRSPYLLRGKRRGLMRDGRTTEQMRRDPNESSDEEPRRDVPDTPTPTERRARGKDSQSQAGQGSQAKRRSKRVLARRPRGDEDGGESHFKHTPYCTQKCLLGLVGGGVTDSACPNKLLHCRKPANDRGHCLGRQRANAQHPIDRTEFLRLLQEQLERSLDYGIVSLRQSGARGVLFKVSLLAYGYTFVSKGTREAAFYKRLRGVYVPVFLGSIDLRTINRTYFYDHRVYIVHMSFLSWGGQDLYEMKRTDCGVEDLEAMKTRSLNEIRALGHHADRLRKGAVCEARSPPTRATCAEQAQTDEEGSKGQRLSSEVNE
ncbi:LOW QUALITY PROTEIN: uncharacterized protein BDZ83DRAFT_724514 [Colletotrichum acutatum]|uniref:Uncharacterized protein n=1 Tax=Glomerella acutata TaxID=27357 RepID=A0AAD8UAA4_GLOAC|nr:LOW QUALITY PROTEIN: uncharacterized protein BDZ83DRAFT_724514 [Colletotrichum acutatum]KAK1707762.1 LOW QUALITY PROTEIN: hypothetical protein BDZ83DRAFT_724514 [Colletotrichum acutatum]